MTNPKILVAGDLTLISVYKVYPHRLAALARHSQVSPLKPLEIR
jgi:hypothetical protein